MLIGTKHKHYNFNFNCRNNKGYSLELFEYVFNLTGIMRS